MTKSLALPVETIRAIELRRASFVAGIPDELKAREDRIERALALKNASAHSKLGEIYRLVDEIAKFSIAHTPCGKGCSSCCRMNVEISEVEANKIQRETGSKFVPLRQSIMHPLTEFSGMACPFLTDDACSIYQSRPLVCRSHFSFDTTPHWCSPDRMGMVEVPLIRFDGVQAAFFSLTKRGNGGVFADIRDFFPSGASKN